MACQKVCKQGRDDKYDSEGKFTNPIPTSLYFTVAK